MVKATLTEVNDRTARSVIAVDSNDAQQFSWGLIQWLCSGEISQEAEMTFGYVEIDAGQKNPRHYHPNSDEVLYLMAGELHHSLNDTVHHLKPGMAIHIPRGVEHDAVNKTDQVARMVVAYPTQDRQVVMCEAGQEGQE